MKKILIGTLAVCSLAASSMALQYDLLATRVAPGTTLADMSATLNFAVDVDGTGDYIPIGARPATGVFGPTGSPARYSFQFDYDNEFLPIQDNGGSVTFSNLVVTVCGHSGYRTVNNLEYTFVPATPTLLPALFGPGVSPWGQPFPLCGVPCVPGCTVSAMDPPVLVATNANPTPTGTFTICNTANQDADPPCPSISGAIGENCDLFSVSHTGYTLAPGECLTVTVTFAPIHGIGQITVCDIITDCGTVIASGDNEVAAEETPAVFALGEAYPNPFNPSTTIAYSVPETQKVTLNVFNTNGQLVQTLVNGMIERGAHKVIFDASNLSSGVYVYSLQAGTESSLKKMVLVK